MSTDIDLIPWEPIIRLAAEYFKHDSHHILNAKTKTPVPSEPISL